MVIIFVGIISKDKRLKEKLTSLFSLNSKKNECRYELSFYNSSNYDFDFDLKFLNIMIVDKNTCKNFNRLKEGNFKMIVIGDYSIHLKDSDIFYLSSSFNDKEFIKIIDEIYEEEYSKVSQGEYCILAKEGVINLDISKVDYIGVRGDFSYFHLKDKVIKTKKSLENIFKELSSRLFVKCSKRAIVNLVRISYIKNSICYLKSASVRISREYKDKLKERYIDFILNSKCFLLSF